MPLVTQLSLFVENRPGTLGRICRVLAANGLDILGFTIADAVDHGVVRLVVSNPDDATQLLEQAGFLVLHAQVVAVEVAGAPGGLAGVVERLATQGINIAYAYGSQSGQLAEGARSLVYLSSDRPEDALDVLESPAAEA